MQSAPFGADFDVVVAGAGLAGLAAALGLAQAGFMTALCGPPDPLGKGRSVALHDGSVRLLAKRGVWGAVEAAASPLRKLRLVDDVGALFAAPRLEFRSQEIGLDAFGWNVENAELAEILGRAAGCAANLTWIASPVAAYSFSPQSCRMTLADGNVLAARLAVGADGRGSLARQSAGIGVRARPYAQVALTAILAHARPHDDASTEFHTRQGPFTFVPLAARPGAPMRSSLVWAMSPAESKRRAALGDAALAGEIERQSRSMLGALRILGERGVFPVSWQAAASMTGERLALVGDAAHGLPPIGAQGLNLGLRDGEGLIEALVEARFGGQDIGGAKALARYGALRRFDVASRAAIVDALNRSLIAGWAPLDFGRSVGLAALGAIGPLRRFAMRQGVAPRRAG